MTQRLNHRIAGLLVVAIAGACTAGVAETPPEPPTIGLVTNNPNGMRNVGGFIAGMEELGYVDGETVSYVFAGEPVTGDDLDRTLTAMVAADVDLIFTAGTPTGIAAYRATKDTDIPVVFGVIADPIGAGVMDDLTAPGGNPTGVKTNPDHGRRLELLLELAPATDRVLVPYNPNDAAATSAVDQLIGLAPGLGIDLVLREATDDAGVATSLRAIPEGVDAIFLVPDSVVNAHLAEILEVAKQERLVTSGPSTAQVEEGALVAFGFIHHEAGAQAARMADRVLKGAAPGTLPVEDTESYLAFNLATAEAIGLAIPDGLLRQAALVLDSTGSRVVGIRED